MGKEIFKANVDYFVKGRQKKSKQWFESDKISNLTLVQLINKTSILSENTVENFFSKEHQYQLDKQTVEMVRSTMHIIRKKINDFSPQKRFFILETIDFFRSKTHIGRLLPAMLVLKGEKQKREILEFFYSTFNTLNKNVETIISTPEMFKTESLHVERGSLYSFSIDVAKLVLQLFKEDYVSKFNYSASEVELVKKVFNQFGPGKFLANPFLLSQFSENENEFYKTILSFVSTIQTHDVLFLYAQKRHVYYKRFLLSLVQSNRIKEIDPIDISRVFAGCLLKNPQLDPGESLVNRMIDEDQFNKPKTLKALVRYINDLSPSSVYMLINNIRSTLQTISNKRPKQKTKHEGKKKTAKDIFSNIWKKQ